MSWKPLLEGKDASAAIIAAQRLAGLAVTMLADRARTSIHPGSVGLAGGLAGAVVHDQYVAAYHGKRSREARSRLELLAQRVSSDPAISPSLFTGHSGALWALARTSPTHAMTVDGLRNALVDGLTGGVDRPTEHEFDLIRGMAGVVQLARVLISTSGTRRNHCRSAGWLVDSADPAGYWRTPVRSSRRAVIPSVADEYYVDWGIAHGCSGAAATLVRYAADLGNRTAATTILTSVTSALDRHSTRDDGHPRPAVRLPRFSGPKGVEHERSFAWCYGEAGVGAAIGLCWLSIGRPAEAGQ